MSWGGESIWLVVATFASGLSCVVIGGLYLFRFPTSSDSIQWGRARIKRWSINLLGTSIALSGLSLMLVQVILWSDRFVT